MKATFERNRAGKSTYECQCCNRQTRDTGLGELGCDLCAFCFEASGIENSFSDGAIDFAEFQSTYEQLVKQYGKRAHVECCSMDPARYELPVIEAPVTPVNACKVASPSTDRRLAANKNQPARTKSQRARDRKAQRASLAAAAAVINEHDCIENAVEIETDGALGHGWECGICHKFLQAG